MSVCALTPDNLERRGYRQVRAGIWARLRLTGEAVKGSAVVFTQTGCFVVGATMSMREAKSLGLRICNAIADGVARKDDQAQIRKAKAEKLLSALMLTQLQPPEVGAEAESDVNYIVGEIVRAKFEDGEEVGKARRHQSKAERKIKRQARRRRFRESLHRFSKKIANSKVMQKLRKGWAKVITGPLGRGAAKVVGGVLQIFGVPSKATETAIRAHHERQASRLREGGWAGVIARGTEKKGAWKGALKQEAKRFGAGYKKAAQDVWGGGGGRKAAGKAARGLASKAGVGYEVVGAQRPGVGYEVVGEHELARQLMQNMYRGPFEGIGARNMYALGAGCV